MGNAHGQQALFTAPAIPGEVPLFGEVYEPIPDAAYERAAALDEPGDHGQVDPAYEAGNGLSAAELWPELVDQAPAAALDVVERCAACYRRPGECEPGHDYRTSSTQRPRGEKRFPAGALVQIMGGPREYVSCLGVVELVESGTMRVIRLGRDRRATGSVRIGVRGLRLFVGKGSAL